MFSTQRTLCLEWFVSKKEWSTRIWYDTLTLAEAVAGTVIPWLPIAGISLSDYPKLIAWCDRLMARPAWQATHPTPEELETFRSLVAARMAG